MSYTVSALLRSKTTMGYLPSGSARLVCYLDAGVGSHSAAAQQWTLLLAAMLVDGSPAIIGTCDSFSLVPLLLPISNANQSPSDQVNSRCLLDTDAAGTQHCFSLAQQQKEQLLTGVACRHSQSLTTSEFPVFTLPTLMGLLLL